MKRKNLFLTLFLFIFCVLGLASCEDKVIGCTLNLSATTNSISYEIKFNNDLANTYDAYLYRGSNILAKKEKVNATTTTGSFTGLSTTTEYTVAIIVEGLSLISKNISTTDIQTLSFNVVKFEDQFLEYTGKPQAPKVEKNANFPAEATFITEPSTVREIGKHTVKLTVTCPGYKSLVITKTVEVVEATYTDIDSIKFNGGEFTYDGKPHSIYVDESTLPAGFKVTGYENNSMVEAGTYTVTATIKKDGYKAIQKTAILTIQALTYEGSSNIKFEDLTVDFDGQVHGIYVDEAQLPEGTKITYINNEKKDPGEYLAEATIQIPGYRTIKLTAKLTIKELEYDYSKIKFEDKYVKYNGAIQSIEIDMKQLPENSVVEYNNNYKTEVGQYDVVANVTVPGYKKFTLEAKLTITENDPDFLELDFSDRKYSNSSLIDVVKLNETVESITTTNQGEITGTNHGISAGSSKKSGTITFKFTRAVKSISITFSGWTSGGNTGADINKKTYVYINGENPVILTNAAQEENVVFETPITEIVLTSTNKLEETYEDFRFFVMAIEVNFA